jgi:hypothetical protein
LIEQQREALRRLQRQLEQFYELEHGPDVTDFIRLADAGARETLLVRETEDALEIALVLPRAHALEVGLAHPEADTWLQLVEGVSHFVYVVERARTCLPATQLELELQAEVDKFVVLALNHPGLGPAHARSVHGGLFENVRFLHPAHTEAGQRYRLANGLAARFVARLVELRAPAYVRRALRRFYRSGQADKIRLAQAA